MRVRVSPFTPNKVMNQEIKKIKEWLSDGSSILNESIKTSTFDEETIKLLMEVYREAKKDVNSKWSDEEMDKAVNHLITNIIK